MQNGNQMLEGNKAYFHQIVLMGGTQNWRQNLRRNKTITTLRS